jgi:histone acetyltransferase 1
VDDVEGTFSTFIPPGMLTIAFYSTANGHQLRTDYYRDRAAFAARVEEDALSFKPLGTLIYSYTRPSPLCTGKRKGTTVALDPESEDAVVFEVYHVSRSLTAVVLALKFSSPKSPDNVAYSRF